MLRVLPMPAIDSLAAHVGQAQFVAGQEVFHQGDHGDRFYVIGDGGAEGIGGGRLIGTGGPGGGRGGGAGGSPTAASSARWAGATASARLRCSTTRSGPPPCARGLRSCSTRSSAATSSPRSAATSPADATRARWWTIRPVR